MDDSVRKEIANMRRRLGADANRIDGFVRDLFPTDEKPAKELMDIGIALKGHARHLAQVAGFRDDE